MRRKWRCFHCDAVFTNQFEAGIHFGADQAATCACVLPHEQHLVEHNAERVSVIKHHPVATDMLAALSTAQRGEK